MMINTADTTGHDPAALAASRDARPFTTQTTPTTDLGLPVLCSPSSGPLRRVDSPAEGGPASDLGFKQLAISNPADLRFGVSPKPLVTRQGLTIGGGLVYPEINFTLPPMFVDQTTMPDVRKQYQQIITGVLQRAVELEAPGMVVEFETLPPMTENPAWGIELTRILLDGMLEAHAKHGLKSVLRITPNDTREMLRPPRMRSGPLYEAMLTTFDGCAAAGPELLSIESVGGKEVHDEALADGRDAALLYRKWMISSDASRDPQAYVLTPESSIAIAQSIVSSPTAYEAGKAAALTAVQLLRDAHRDGALKIHPREVPYLDRLQKVVEALPAKEAAFIDEMMAEVDTTKFVAADYGIG